MADYFLDSSALVKRYVSEIGSAWASGLFDPVLSNEVFVAAITSVEIVAAVTRRARGRTITTANAASTCNQFRADWLSDYQVVEVNEMLLQQAMTLAETYGLRGYDAVQLAAGRQINRLCTGSGLAPIVFISADSELNNAAIQEGLIVDNPNLHP
jgi:predicted nucleic acid-binding protein